MGRRQSTRADKVLRHQDSDVINVMGDTDATAKSVNARAVALMDQQTVDQIHAMEANFGKTWLMGKVTAIDGTKSH